jgi:hypothetical protein
MQVVQVIDMYIGDQEATFRKLMIFNQLTVLVNVEIAYKKRPLL